MALQSLSDLLEDELKDLYSAETQLLKALPKMAKRAAAESLKEAFAGHLTQTQGHVKRLEQIGRILDIDLHGKTCQAMKGLVKEGDEAMSEKGPDAVIDSAIIGAARRVEHYEIAAYCATRGMAEQLGRSDVAELLEETMNEEDAADQKLKGIAKDEVFVQAAETETSEEDADKAETSSRGRRTSR